MVGLGLAAAVAMAPAPAGAETVPGARPLKDGTAAFATNGAGTSAVAFESRGGVLVSISRPGAPFVRPVRVGGPARGARFDHEMHVAVGEAGDVVVVWERFDGTDPPDEEDRDDSGCCMRIHAARITAAGRRRPTRILSRAGADAFFTGMAVSPAGRVAVSWDSGTWRVRTAARHGRFGRARTLTHSSGGSQGAIAFAGRVLRALFLRRGGRHVYERRLPGRSRRITRRFVSGVDDAFVSDRWGRLLLSSPKTLLAVTPGGRGRVRKVQSRDFMQVLLAATPAGRLAHAVLPEYTRAGAHVRLGATDGSLGPARRLSAPLRVPWARGRLAVSAPGDAALFVIRDSSRMASLYMANAGRFGPPSVQARRVARYRTRRAALLGAAYDTSGRPFAVVRVDRRLRVVRP
jgi:hypothetical protein